VNKDTYPTLVDIVSDRLFIADLETSARLQSAAVNSDVYSYTFDYRGAVSKSNSRTNSNVNLGASHGDDTLYVLSGVLNPLSTEKDRQMSQVFLDLFISFMQSRVPNITSEWQPVKKSNEGLYSQLRISGPEDYEMEFKKEIGQRTFWDNLPFNENHNFNKQLVKDEL